DRVAAALAQDRATRGNTNGAGGPEGNTVGNAGGQGGAPPARECTYSSFIKCNPTCFHGNEGAVELCRWFEKTESVFSISECAKRNKVKFVAATLQGRAHLSLGGKRCSYPVGFPSLLAGFPKS
ncbi:hypothetical protein Tco_1488425, partial [Tanacetum coccineum]